MRKAKNGIYLVISLVDSNKIISDNIKVSLGYEEVKEWYILIRSSYRVCLVDSNKIISDNIKVSVLLGYEEVSLGYEEVKEWYISSYKSSRF